VHDTRILIVGAGIAGLGLGRALLSHGLSAEIVERATAWPATGAGLYLPGNGVRALAALGLGEALMARAVRLSHQRILDQRGRLLAEIDLPRVWGSVGPCVGIRRGDLHRILLEGAAAVPIRLGTTVRAVTQDHSTVSVQFAEGLTRSYDIVIGADGINSSIRRLVFGEIRPRDVGQVSWRFIAKDAPAVTNWTVMLAPHRAFLMVPMGSGDLYCYADVTSRETDGSAGRGDVASQGLAQHAGRDQLRTLFRDFAEPVTHILAQLDRIDPLHVARIEEIDLDQCARGRVVLVGDAAHATSPNMAQGASMALEDALILAQALSADQPLTAALASFAARRRARVRWVRQRTHRRDRLRNLPALLRNLSLRVAGSALYEMDYRPLCNEP
jgi:2-polyprenyl-6-methoxyphenol hydroxylase-like FAD-dependent oxidoreductase